jgi:TatD DNase family protein
MHLIDTHTHLYVKEFDEDREAVFQRALALGIKQFYLPSIDSVYTQRMFDLEAAYPEQVQLMMGLHPTHVKENATEELAHVKQHLNQRPFAAVGEIGIDLFWDKTFIKEQQHAFDVQIQWAKEKNLPIVIHCREAFDEVFEVLESHKGDSLKGIFHCFTGTLEQAKRTLGFNLKLGIGGVVTFKNGKIDQFLDQIPLEAIVLETDAPYLAPVPYRGKRNESSYLIEVVQKLADIYHVSPEKIADLTTNTALSIFEK